MDEVERAQVLAYRFAAHELRAPGSGDVVLATGIQDYPPGRSASLALRLRTIPRPDVVLAHSVRGAMHLHHGDDLARLVAALRFQDVRDVPPLTLGPFGAELAQAEIGLGDALDDIAEAMRAAVADGATPTKAELSGAVSPKVPSVIAPWCEGCGVHHVQDQLFRMATLQAGLVIELDSSSPSMFRFRPADMPLAADVEESRAELVREFLATFGPAKPAHLASWLSISPAAARRWWELVADELRQVAVDGRKHWAHVEQLDLLWDAPGPSGIRLLPPYDPIAELADRPLLVPDPVHRKAVWRTAANPGIVLVDGEISGVWRQRRTRDRLVMKIEAFAELSARQRKAAETDAATIADHVRARDFELAFD